MNFFSITSRGIKSIDDLSLKIDVLKDYISSKHLPNAIKSLENLQDEKIALWKEIISYQKTQSGENS